MERDEQAWREFEAMAKRPLSERIRYGFIKSYRPVLDDESYRSFESMEEYRQWCDENLPPWLGFSRLVNRKPGYPTSMANVAEMTLGEWQARQIEKAAKILSHFVESTKEDRLKWQPKAEEGSKTRSVMEQLGECVFANRRFLAFFRGEEAPAMPESFDTFGSVAEGTKALQEAAAELAAEVRKLQGDDLMRTIDTHRGPMPTALAMQFPVRNMTYHMGQINMIQLLYGDTDFHINEEFLTL